VPRLDEEAEDTLQILAQNADAVVGYRDGRKRPFDPRRDADVPARAGVLDAVRDEVPEYLREPDRIAVKLDRLGWDVDRERLMLCRDLRSPRVDGGRDHVLQRDRLEPQRQLVLRDAAHVDEIVDEADQVLALPAHDRNGAAQIVILDPRLDELDAIEQRRERIA